MDQDPMKIDASATKDFFISILIRDIDLAEAIVDLVDNSVDGARKMRGDGDLKGLYVHLELEANKFRITDNCGGIEAEVARKYAFRFGRDSDDPPPVTKHSVGQFGVGMKRAIFKLGNEIKIVSNAPTSRFTVDFKVADWKKDSDWDLKFIALEEGITVPENELSTDIEITGLNESPSKEIVLGAFHTKLRNMIESAHAESVNKGFEIKIGPYVLSALHPKLLKSAELTPIFKTLEFYPTSPNPVVVRIYAGILDSNPSEAGWNVICNGRTILAANQDDTTGWGEGTPRFHHQYSRFRGYIYFDCDDAGRLPWNTTKTDVDAELPIYQAVKLEMINCMKPVLEFLNKLDREKDTEENPLTDSVDKSDPVQFEYLANSSNFVYKAVPVQNKNKLTRITYQKNSEEVEKAKKMLNAASTKEVGEKTFNYFMTMEGDE